MARTATKTLFTADLILPAIRDAFIKSGSSYATRSSTGSSR